MIFWIIIAITALVAIIIIWANYDDGLAWATGLLAVPLTGGFVLLLAVGIPALCLPNSAFKVVATETVNLRSLGSGDGIKGRSYFLGGGYIGSEKVLSYIRSESDGASKLRSAPAWASTIYEVGEKPTLITTSYEKRAWWLAPFAVASVDNYEFRVPNGTVSDDFAVTTK